MLLAIDIGNTHTHYGVVSAGRTLVQAELPTPRIADPVEGLAPRIGALQASHGFTAAAFCTVVPAAAQPCRDACSAFGLSCWQLTHTQKLGIPITYPRPAEIGQDRLANAAGARSLFAGPAVVVGLGTAVIFDIITTHGGYEGGIISPGPALVTRYLHERTAQLPLVEDLDGPISSVIGKSTADAIRIGAAIGYPGLIQALLDAVLAELATRGEPTPALLTSGGAARVIRGRLRQSTRDIPDLTLLGLAAAWSLNHS